jgi:hypothetical protein
VLAVPPGAGPDQVGEVAAWVAGGGMLSKDQRRRVREGISERTGASTEELSGLMTGIRWELGLDERRAIPELFSRAGVSDQVGPVRWYQDPGAADR